MRYFLIVCLAVLTFATGLSNYVSALIYRVNGTWSTAYVDGIGQPVATTLGPAAPQPAWMPQPPGTVIITASRSYTGPQQRQFAKLDIVTRMATADLERFYLERLGDAGFVVARRDAEVMEPRLARFFGIDATIELIHPDESWRLQLIINSANGLILPSRIVSVAWWGWPFEPPVAQRSR